MTAFMKMSQWTGLYRDELPPAKITQAALDAAGMRAGVDDATETALTVANHWAFGTVAGTLFGAVSPVLRLPLPPALQGTVFGLVVWFISYMGWVPAAGLMRHPRQQRLDQALMPLLAHVVYGLTLGMAFGALERRTEKAT
jgi:uncharacterized membrane protein YagU involved in acid resistance